MLALLATTAIGAYFYVRMDQEIRRHVEQELADQFPQLVVRVGDARIIEGKGIAISEIELSDPMSGFREGRLLRIDELLLVCNATLPDILQDQLDVRRIEVKRPEVWLRRGLHGRWNFQSLLPLESCGGTAPQVFIHGGSLHVVDEAAKDRLPLELRDIALEIAPTGQQSPGRMPSVVVAGSLAGPFLQRVDVRGEFEGSSSMLRVECDVDRLHISEELAPWWRPLLPPAAQQTSLSTTLSGKASLQQRCGDGGAPSFSVQLNILGGEVRDPHLPRPLTDLRGRVIADNQTLQLENISGKCGPASVLASLNRNGWSSTATMAAAARVTDCPLDLQLYRALPPMLQNEWDKYKPDGVVDAKAWAVFDQGRWKPSAVLTGRDLAFESDKFAYRLRDGAGTMRYQPADAAGPARIDLDMTGVGGGQRLRLVGAVLDPCPGAVGRIDITGEGLEVEPAMIEALETAPREVIRSLHPRGRFDVHLTVARTKPGQLPQTQLRLDLRGMSINYEKFSYPLTDVRGVVQLTDRRWTFANLTSGGRHPIRAHGTLEPAAEGTQLHLHFAGEQAELDPDLYDALNRDVQRAWTLLQPRGKFDFTADVSYLSGQPQPSIQCVILPRPEDSQLKPEFFQYLLERVGGRIEYHDGHVQLVGMTAEHDQTRIRTNGEGYFAPDGRWRMKLTDLAADHVRARTDLFAALPEQLGSRLEKIRPTGNFSIHDGTLQFRRGDSPIAVVESSWDVQLECVQSDLHFGVDVQNVHGGVRFVGQSDGQRSWTGGELDLESLTFLGMQITNVRGPLWIDDAQCRLGTWATEALGTEPRRITANVYGGSAAGDGWIKFDGLPNYGVDAIVRDGDLNRLMVERVGAGQQLLGRFDANVQFRGEGDSLNRLRGAGDVHIHEANMYQLPMLASMLKLIKTGSADAIAFDESDVKFRVESRHVYLDQLDFLGDVVNLYGRGYTTIDQQQLELAFRGVVGRHDYRLPLVKKVVGQVNEQILQISVKGTVAEPQVTTEALPGVSQWVERMWAATPSAPWSAPPLQADRPGPVSRQ